MDDIATAVVFKPKWTRFSQFCHVLSAFYTSFSLYGFHIFLSPHPLMGSEYTQNSSFCSCQSISRLDHFSWPRLGDFDMWSACGWIPR